MTEKEVIMIQDPDYELFYRESEGAEWRFGDSCHNYAEAESGAISLFKSKKAAEVEVFEVVADQRRRIFSAYMDSRGHVYGHREDEIDREEQRRRQEQQERQEREEEKEKQKQREIDTGYGFGF
jgi:hypothetical protein